MYLFSVRFNNKLVQFVSPVPDPLGWAVDAVSLSLEDLDPYAFPLVAILCKMVARLQDYPCRRIILIALQTPHALGLESSVHVKPDTSVPAQPATSTDTAFQSDSSQESVRLISECLVPKASTLKGQQSIR